MYVFTPEAFPTRLRAVAMGSGSACARVGAMLTPYVAQVLLASSPSASVAVYAALGFLAAAVALLLPVETSGKDLDSGDAGAPGGAAPRSPERGLVADMEQNEQEQQQERQQQRQQEERF